MNTNNQYDTQLTPEQEAAYLSWLGPRRARDTDYDWRGFFQALGDQEELGPVYQNGGHAPDTWKKPSHPTFSDESIYHGVAGNVGGHWQGNSYMPGESNPSWLPMYMQRVEPNVRLSQGNANDQIVFPGWLR